MNKKLLKIKYEISSGIPFKWEYEIKDNTICEYLKSISKGEKTKKPICGGKVETTYIFRGIKKGTTKIIFKLVNFADNYISKTDEYNIEIDKDNNILLLSQKEKINR